MDSDVSVAWPSVESKEVSDDIEVVAINDLTSPVMLAQLLQFDSTHGTYPGTVTATDDAIVVDGEETKVYAEPDASKIPWVKENGVDIVFRMYRLLYI